MLHYSRQINSIKNHSIHKLIYKLIVFHLLVLFFMIPIRSMFLDIVFLRDFIIYILIFLSIGIFSFNLKEKNIYNSLDKMIFSYLILGIIISLFFILYSGLDLLSAIKEYRNHFLPFILFFVSRSVITDYRMRIKISNFLFIMLIILIFTTLFEYFLIKVMDISPYNFPWYKYIFMTSDRYLGNIVGGLGYIDPLHTPILGLFGWSHSTAAVLMCLLGFNYPFIISSNKDETLKMLLINKLPKLFSYILLLLTAFIIFVVLKVKMHMLTFIFLLTLFPAIISKTNIFKNLFFTSILAVMIYNLEFIRDPIISSIITGYVGAGVSSSTLNTIFDINPLIILNNWSIISIFFGDYSLSAGGEFRILDYTLRFGVIWLVIFISLFLIVFVKLRSCISDKRLFYSDKFFINGIIYLLLISYIDMAHYARAMTWPIIDIIAISLGCLSPFINYVNFKILK